MTAGTPRKTSPLPAVIAVVVLIVLAVVFVSEMADVSGGGGDAPPPEETLTADSYQADVESLLTNAEPVQGLALVQRYGCTVCHDGPGADNRLAPRWDDIGVLAATRRPPLSAEAYLYESIIHPTAFEVEGYTGNMPLIYDRMIADDELGHIIAYLLSRTDE